MCVCEWLRIRKLEMQCYCKCVTECVTEGVQKHMHSKMQGPLFCPIVLSRYRSILYACVSSS
uniref:Uncharacterized protein n=1 Tax=Anguilla anguilla TaxID=7936 RepID=A0A0E9XHS2_ANGAN